MIDKQRDYLLKFGDAVWSVAHLLVLVGSTSMRQALEAREGQDSAVHALARLTFEWGTLTHVARAMWFVARGGKRALMGVKSVTAANGLTARIYRETALTAIALSSEKLRAEATKALSSRELPLPDPDPDPVGTLVGIVGSAGRAVLDDRAATYACFLEESREITARVLARRMDVTEDEAAAIPEDVARILLANAPSSIHHDDAVPVFLGLMQGLPWLVRASPAELFLPAAWASKLLPPRSLDHVLGWLTPYASAQGLLTRREPLRAAGAPGRNDPCSCGSGKKYKRCCASR